MSLCVTSRVLSLLTAEAAFLDKDETSFSGYWWEEVSLSLFSFSLTHALFALSVNHTHTQLHTLPRCSGAGQCVGLAGMLWHSPLVIPLIC